MSNELIDEHEQGERVRQWLRDNGSAIVGGIAVGLALIFGWQWWERSEIERQITAATQFQALVDASATRDAATVDSLAGSLREQYGKTAYAALAALQQAELAVSQGKHEAAAAALDQALATTTEPALRELIQVRRARLDLQMGSLEAGLDRLKDLSDSRFTAVVAELRGDLLQRLGRNEEARAAYADALAAMDAGAQLRFLVEMKLADLGGSDAVEG